MNDEITFESYEVEQRFNALWMEETLQRARHDVYRFLLTASYHLEESNRSDKGDLLTPSERAEITHMETYCRDFVVLLIRNTPARRAAPMLLREFACRVARCQAWAIDREMADIYAHEFGIDLARKELPGWQKP